jgi:hypothetical protein
MATEKQRQAVKKNMKRAQSEGRGRKKPGATGDGNYYHIDVRPKGEFSTFRTQDVGGPGHLLRVAGKRSSGSWSTAAWLISKDDAHIEGDKLIGDTKDAKDLLKNLRTSPVHLSGDRFNATDRPDVPERSKPTAAQTRARRENIKKAQSARRKKT